MRQIAIVISLLLSFSAEICFAKEVRVTLLQANDVYEMTPVSGGKFGGLARVESILKDLKKRNRHTYSVLAGDLISPSAIGTAKVDGKRLNGKQMVDVLNAMSWDYFTIGNHEFDNGYEALVNRLAEAEFKTVSSNVMDTSTGLPFKNTTLKDVINVKGVKIGFAGITLQSLSKDFVTIKDPLAVAKSIVTELKESDKADVVVLITHQSFADDVLIAEKIEGVDLILGGHEHENLYARRGMDSVPIAKADANARSVYIHDLVFDTKTAQLNIQSRLKIIDKMIPEDKRIKGLVDEWVDRAFAAFEQEGFEPRSRVCITTEPLDGLEASVRNGETNLTELISRSAISELPGSSASLFNGGSIRIDDVLPAGVITQYDVIRILPFSGTSFTQVKIPGDLLVRALNVGRDSRGTGAFLHGANITELNDVWNVNGQPIVNSNMYTIAISTFLIERGDTGLEFLVNNPRIQRVPGAVVDARRALISQLQKSFSSL